MKNDSFNKKLSNIQLDNNLQVSKCYSTWKSMELSNSKKRYAEWSMFSKKNDLNSTEFLVPRIKKQIDLAIPSFMKNKNKNLSRSELEKYLQDLSPWGYYFDLEFGLKTTYDQTNINRTMFLDQS